MTSIVALARRAKEDPNFQFHYVTAREMYNLVRAAEAGWQGSVALARDYEFVANRLKSFIVDGSRDHIEEMHIGSSER